MRFTDRRTFAFSRGNKLLVVLTNGNYSEAVPRPAEYRLSGLDGFAGARLCDALHSGVSRGSWACCLGCIGGMPTPALSLRPRRRRMASPPLR